MLVGTLYSHCIDVIVQEFFLYKNGRTTSKLVGQFKQADIVTQVLSHRILHFIIKRYPFLITDDILKLLCHTNLHQLNLTKCKHVTVDGLAEITERCNITNLDLSNCGQLMTNDVHKVFNKNTTNISSLTLNNNIFADAVIQGILESLPLLTSLSIQSCESLHDHHILASSEFGKHLTHVNVSGCHNISSTFIRHLTFVTQSNLQSIDISWTNIDCTALLYLAGYSLHFAAYLATSVERSNNKHIVHSAMQNSDGIQSVQSATHNSDAAPSEHDQNSHPRNEFIPITQQKHSKASSCGSILLEPLKQDQNSHPNNEFIPLTQKHSKTSSCDSILSHHNGKSASEYTKELCAFCIQELAIRNPSQSSSSTDLFYTESYDDYDVIDGHIMTLLEQDKTLLNSCVDAASALHLEWDILSIEDIHLNIQPVECTCSVSDDLLGNIFSQQANRSNSLNSVCSDEPMIAQEKEENHFQQLFIPRLTHVDISQIDFYDYNLGRPCLEYFVKANQNLEKFHISWSEFDDELLSFVSRNEVSMRDISLVDCEKITNDGILSLAKHCHQLQVLDMKGVACVTDHALLPLVNNNTNLYNIHFAESALTDATLKAISSHEASTLHALDLSWCENITNDGVLAILQHCEKLLSLDLRQCNVGQETVRGITRYGTHLTSLGVSGILGLNDTMCQPMLKALPHLRKLDISWNSSLTDETISTLFLSCLSIQEVLAVGLSRITSIPFLHIISNWKSFHQHLEAIRVRLRNQLGRIDSNRSTYMYEVVDSEFYLPYRSISYASNLSKLALGYCDKVQDEHLGEIVAVCRNSLIIEDYYGEPIKPMWKDFVKSVDTVFL